MKKLIVTLILTVVCISITVFAADNADPVMKQNPDGTYIINTATLCHAKGFRDVTPVEVYVKNDAVIKIVALENRESPNYFDKVKCYLFPLFVNKKVKNARELTNAQIPDGCTGATYSTRAVQANIAAALEYYHSHK